MLSKVDNKSFPRTPEQIWNPANKTMTADQMLAAAERIVSVQKAAVTGASPAIAARDARRAELAKLKAIPKKPKAS